MSNAENLLNTLSSAGQLATSFGEGHIVIDNKRVVTVPDKLKRLAVQYDHDIETVTFDCPRYWDGIDMSEMSIYINYLRLDTYSGSYKVQNVTVDSSNSTKMHFDWTISRNVTSVIGKLVFLVCIRKTDENGNEVNHWNSELCKDCYISEGLEVDGEELKELYPDIIEQWHNEVLGVIDEMNTFKQEMIAMRDSGAFDGATFTPSVSETGDLSWTNDRGRENPETVNVRGQSPTIEVTDIQGGHRVTITDVNGTSSFDVMNTIIDKTEAATQMLNDFVYIGSVEPTSTPVIWFNIVDTAYQVTLSDGITLNTLMFQDEFDGDGLSSTWKPAYGHDNPALTNWWTADSKNLGVENSCLRLTMLRDNPTSAYEISAAKVETTQYGADNNYNFDTGYCEVKFKLDRVGEGIWPAIWTVGQSMSESFSNITDSSVIRKTHGRLWPWAGEIDQMDAMKSQFGPGGIYQTDDYDSSAKGLSGEGIENKTLEADTWYILGLYKSKDKIKVYFDRVLIGSFDISDNECFSGMGENLIINISTGTVGGTLPEEINEVNMYVDYVRVYSLSNSMTTLAEQNTESLLPDCANGFACVAGRSWLLRPEFALNTQNTALYWESDNTAIAKVENGYVTTVANGVCNIIAKDVNGNIVINFALTVKENAGVVATGIKVTSSVEGVAANSSAEITANIYPTNCDSLTPTLTVISGADYCTIDGTTISNNNTSGEDQAIVVRVGTNNPSVYEDITITLLSAVDYSVTPSTNLLANYNVDGMSNGVKWADSLGFGNTLSYTSGNVTFTGLALNATNALWNFNTANNKPITTEIPEAFTIMIMANMSGTGSPISCVNGDGIYMSHTTNMRLYASTNVNVSVPEYQGTDCVFAMTWASGEVKAHVMIGNSDAIYSATGTSKASTPADISGLYVIAHSNGNGFVGSVYQALLFDTALDVDSIKNYAAQMFAKN